MEAKFITHWKDEMKRSIRLRYYDKELSEAKLDQYLDKVIEKRMNNRSISLVNNYTNTVAKTNILSIIDIIEENNLITAAGGCLFLQHGVRRNLLYEFIQYLKAERNAAKKRRKKYDKGTLEWLMEDITQLNVKLIMNSLYGCMGYPGFILFNLFLAEAITNQGRHIITSCTAAIENYMGSAFSLTSEGEAITYINNIDREFYINDYDKLIDTSIFDDISNIYDLCYNHMIKHCHFIINESFTNVLRDIVYNMPLKEVIVLYYKNNLIRFNNNQFMKDNIKYIIDNNGNLVFGSIDYLSNDKMKECAAHLLDIYSIFVIYNYPVYDKVRKAMYQPKTKTLYTDTDSVFISFDELVRYTMDIYNNEAAPNLSIDETKTTAAFLHFIYVDLMLDMALKTLCKTNNIAEEHSKLLIIKNEFFYSRIVFMNAKKRYIAYALFQEGQFIKDPNEALDIKGLDFKKASTNPYLKEFFTNISLNDIMLADNINPRLLFKKMIDLKKTIEEGIRHGDRRFFKQSNCKTLDNYKNPYSTQQVVATILWNTLVPESALELPAEVYVVPIKSMKFDKPSAGKVSLKTPLDYPNIRKFAEDFPEEYERLHREIYMNENILIRHMSLNSIALPRNDDVKIPDYIVSLINFNQITKDALALFLPVLNSIGLKSLPTTTTDEHMSNIVEL